jgi:glycosyltransferase involved in cell wall biosynthesis
VNQGSPRGEGRPPDLKGFSFLYFIDAAYYGGAERYMVWLAAGAKQAGARVRFLLRKGGALGPLRRELTRSRIGYDEMPLDLPRKPVGLFRLMTYFLRERFDLVHANLPAPYLAQNSIVAPLARASGVRAVLTTEHLPRLPTQFRRGLLKRFCTFFVDRVITVSRANARSLERLHHIGSEKIRVVYNGVPDPGPRGKLEARKELGIDENALLIIEIGELSKRKGQMLLLDAMARLHRKEGWVLWIVGDGPERYTQEQRAGELGLAQRVVFTGYREDVGRILAASDILVLPSELEGMPYVVIEAMALGLPVVASNVDGVPEVIRDGETGLLVPSGEVGPLVASLRELMRQADLRERLGRRGRQVYESGFRLDLAVSGVLDVYRELLSRET